ncbi:MAG: hypothetical protein LC118_12740 [Dehalococcoidia bacterium]|nr:hypothetical protein [Dehalococcoidia bacterium]
MPAMPHERVVRVTQRSGIWLAWTDHEEIKWFESEAEAVQWAMLWAFAERPARAELLNAEEETREILVQYSA